MKNFLIIAASILIFSCQKENINQKAIDRLANLYHESLQNLNYPYHNSSKADKLLAQLNGIPANIPVEARYDAGLELLQAGRNQDCIVLISPVIADEPVKSSNYKYYRLLANAYLRLGEQTNCFHTSGINACTLPFTDKTMHQNTLGSTKAIELYKKMLQYNPKDLESRWLYNIAARTLGKENEIKSEFLVNLPGLGQSEVYFENIFNDPEMGHAGGSSMDDFDNDGDLDLFVSSYHLDENVKYYENSKGVFIDKTKKANLDGITGGLNFIHADVNNDGFLDILILRGAWLGVYGQFPPSLLINQKNGTFQDQTEEWGLLIYQPTQSAVFTDIDLDGKLDLVLGAEATGGLDIPVKVFKNTGSSFEDITVKSGIDVTAFVKGIVASDVNNDGFPDIYISILGGNNYLFLNQGSQIRNFKDVSAEYNVLEPKTSFVTFFFDYDNDGYEDLYVGGYNIDNKDQLLSETIKDFIGDTIDFSYPRLYKNVNGERFENVTLEMNLDHELFAMGGNFGDVNGDGFLDIYLGTGEFNMWAVMPNRLFVNANGQKFEDQSFSSGLAMIQKGHGISFGDFDEDGDEDIFHTIGGAVEGDVFMNYLYENKSPSNNWIKLKIVGENSNKSGIGARVKLSISENGKSRNIFRTINTGGSFGNNSLQLEIGIGSSTIIDSIHINWPNENKTYCTFDNIEINNKYEILERDCSIIKFKK